MVQFAVSFGLIHFGGKHKHTLTLAYCMTHLFCSAFYHATYFPDDWTLNVNGPLMITTQKLSQLAFSVCRA